MPASPLRALAKTGQTAKVIAQVAREEDVLGSVATQVIHLTEVPITLIR